MRDALLLVKVVLRPPQSARARRLGRRLACAPWRLLQRCVYLDKDLVLPPMTMAGGADVFVVASTDPPRSQVMLTRIREQLAKLPELTAVAILEVSASPVLARGQRILCLSRCRRLRPTVTNVRPFCGASRFQPAELRQDGTHMLQCA